MEDYNTSFSNWELADKKATEQKNSEDLNNKATNIDINDISGTLHVTKAKVLNLSSHQGNANENPMRHHCTFISMTEIIKTDVIKY